MKTSFVILSLLALLFTLPAQAGPKKGKGGEGPEYRLVEADAVSIKVSLGKDGNTHEIFKITDATKVTIDGAPGAARDLKAGMMAHVSVSPDHTVALSVEAKDPKAHPSKHRLG